MSNISEDSTGRGNPNKIEAVIGNKVVVINLAASFPNAYPDREDIEYLGIGYYHSIDGIKQAGNILTHFWRIKEKDKNKSDKFTHKLSGGGIPYKLPTIPNFVTINIFGKENVVSLKELPYPDLVEYAESVKQSIIKKHKK